MQNEIGNETLAASVYEENPNQLYPRVHIVNNEMPISSKLTGPLGNDPNVVCPLDDVLPNFNASTHGKAPRFSSTFLNNKISGKSPNISDYGNAPNNDGRAPLPPLYFVLCIFTKKETQTK